MGNVLVVVETQDGHLRTASLPAVTFGKQMAEKARRQAVAAGHRRRRRRRGRRGGQVRRGRGARRRRRRASSTTWPRPTRRSSPRRPRTRAPTVVAATSTSIGQGSDAARGGAARRRPGRPTSSPSSATKQFKRPMMAGNVIATVEVTTPIVVATVRQTEFKPAEAAGARLADRQGRRDRAERHARRVRRRRRQSKSERPELTEAKIVVSGGRGMKEGKNFEQVAALADLLGGAMGASRAACDAGMVPNDLQVGQTGKVVAPQLYIAIAISGAIQHLAGMKGSQDDRRHQQGSRGADLPGRRLRPGDDVGAGDPGAHGRDQEAQGRRLSVRVRADAKAAHRRSQRLRVRDEGERQAPSPRLRARRRLVVGGVDGRRCGGCRRSDGWSRPICPATDSPIAGTRPTTSPSPCTATPSARCARS